MSKIGWILAALTRRITALPLFLQRPIFWFFGLQERALLYGKATPTRLGIWIGEPPETETQLQILFWLHGGGFCVGSPWLGSTFLYSLGKLAKVHVFAASYPLAPEFKYTQILSHVLATFESMQNQHRNARFIIGGDSAGANLAIYLQREHPHLKLILSSPWVDLSMSALGKVDMYAQDMFAMGALEYWRDCVLPLGVLATEPSVSPLFMFSKPPYIADDSKIKADSKVKLRKDVSSKLISNSDSQVQVAISFGKLETMAPAICKYVSNLRTDGKKRVITISARERHSFPILLHPFGGSGLRCVELFAKFIIGDLSDCDYEV